ncbi:MAG: type IX secretion system sortase PorU [Bacteroidia bacterium]
MQRILILITLLLCSVMAHFQAFGQAQHSVLKTGDWYKIPIFRSGVYKIDLNYLSSLGVNTNNINPEHIHIFGNGGGMLPQANATFRYDDLYENPIYVNTQQQNVFQGNDYLLFYAEGPNTWQYNTTADRFVHKTNLYCDTSFYFLNISDLGQSGKRLQSLSSGTGETFTATYTRNHTFHELEKENPAGTGRFWVGELFDYISERTISLYIPDIQENSTLKLRIRTGASSSKSSKITVSIDNNVLGFLNMSEYFGEIKYQVDEELWNVSANAIQGDSLRIKLVFDKNGQATAKAWLDWIEVNYQQKLTPNNLEQKHFALTENIGSGSAAKIVMTDLNGYQIWDITDAQNPKNQIFAANASQNNFSFVTDAEKQKQYITFRNGLIPAKANKIANQDLHGADAADYVMVVHPNFMDAALKLKTFHEQHYGYSVSIATPQQIYNEFSSGRQDVTAIRDYVKLFYDRTAGKQPQYLLLFGDGTYDYKELEFKGKNFIPTYQSREAQNPLDSFTSDDFYTFMSSADGFWGEAAGGIDNDTKVDYDKMDLSVGRLPVETAEEANKMVDKIIRYVTGKNGFGDWRNKIVFVADYRENEAFHMTDLDQNGVTIASKNPCINIDKIYMDNYPVETTASGSFYPEAKRSLLEKLDEGCLIMNYMGHGAEVAWSNSSLLDINDIQNMDNDDRMPAMLTATCEFGRFDLAEPRSGAEQFVIKPEGGAIAMFTTVRKVFVDPNKELNRKFYEYAISKNTEGKMPTLGEIMKNTKNYMYGVGSSLYNINSRNFTLLGDPAIKLNYPQLNAIITQINQKPVEPSTADTVQVLSLVTIHGEVRDENDNFQVDYNGKMEVVIYDKPNRYVTLDANFPFYWQKNRIFNGEVSVKNGLFTVQFVIPIDISYDEGFGKISLYINDTQLDGAGCFSKLFIDGSNTSGTIDDKAPTVNLYINDNKWVDGGTTNPDPDLYAEVADDNGINLTGIGIGHEITAILNEDENNTLVLNDFFKTDANSHQKGTIRYKLRDLKAGTYKLKLRVWDVANNVGEDETTFILADDANTAITEIFNYPNPTTVEQGTTFVVGHNAVGKELEVAITIYTTDGRKIVTVGKTLTANGNYLRDVTWDAKTESGQAIASGVYVYEVQLVDKESGKMVSKSNKLVIVK